MDGQLGGWGVCGQARGNTCAGYSSCGAHSSGLCFESKEWSKDGLEEGQGEAEAETAERERGERIGWEVASGTFDQTEGGTVVRSNGYPPRQLFPRTNGTDFAINGYFVS